MHESTPKSPQLPDAVDTANALVRAGHSVDLNGVVGHKRGTPTLAFTLALGATFALSGILWPPVGLVGLLAVTWSALVELDAGNGWARGLLVRDVDHTIIVWPDSLASSETPNTNPTLVIASPRETDIQTPTVSTQVLMLPLALLLTAAIAVASRTWLGPTLPTIAAGLLGVASLATWCAGWIGTRQPPGNPAREVLLRSMEQANAVQNIHVVWALVGGGATHHDGIETLLLNHAHRLPSEHTRILCLQPSTGVCSRASMDGRVRPQAADPLLDEAASQEGVPQRTGITGARKAMRLGWRAAGIFVSADQIHRGTQVVCGIIGHSDNFAKDTQW
jgi:hypothetical protein